MRWFVQLGVFVVAHCVATELSLIAFAQQTSGQVVGGSSAQLGNTNATNAQSQSGIPGQYRVVNPSTAVLEGNAKVADGSGSARTPNQTPIAQASIEPPFPPLSPEEQQYVDQVLDVWEKSTSKINTFECTFKRWVYNPNTHATHPETVSGGEIRYKNPDKGSFKENTRMTLAGNKPDGSPDYKVNPRLPNGDWWVCDGEWVHQLDRNDKKAIRTQLPPDLRGNNIPLSPLPFLFGVKANEVKARYFVRAIKPPEGNNDVWIEAWPKRADDAGNYSRVQIVIDRKDNLPKGMYLLLPNWTPEAKHRELYEFYDKQVNGFLDQIKQKLFLQSFIDTKVGSDWQVIQEPWIPPDQQPLPQQTPVRALDQQAQPNLSNNRVAAPPSQAAQR